MMKTSLRAALLILALLPAATFADEHEAAGVRLERVLENIARSEGLAFALTAHAPVNVVVGQLDPDDITYAQLHTVLTNNGLAAVAVEDIVNIVPIGAIRQHALPTLTEPDDSVADDQWVTWVYRTERANPSTMIPILRPLLPQQGHLVASIDSRTIVIVDRYANALRVVDLIRDMDENSSGDWQQ